MQQQLLPSPAQPSPALIQPSPGHERPVCCHARRRIQRCCRYTAVLRWCWCKHAGILSATGILSPNLCCCNRLCYQSLLHRQPAAAAAAARPPALQC